MPIIAYDPARNSTSTTFRTHLNYIKCIEGMAAGLTITLHSHPTSALDSSKIAKFERLADITKISIDGEKMACDREKAYAQIAAPWIPVKCYYRLYYLESIFIYLFNGALVGFGHGGHKGVRKVIRELISAGQVTLSAADLGTVTAWDVADAFSAVPGSTIRADYHTSSDCQQSLRKKLSEYIEIDWKQSKGIKNYRTQASRTSKTTELLPKKFSLLDYFYWMRIKANYRDVDFLDFDRDVKEQDAYEYLKRFIEAADTYASALTTAIATLKSQRGM